MVSAGALLAVLAVHHMQSQAGTRYPGSMKSQLACPQALAGTHADDQLTVTTHNHCPHPHPAPRLSYLVSWWSVADVITFVPMIALTAYSSR
jgi:hypothetical protein